MKIIWWIIGLVVVSGLVWGGWYYYASLNCDYIDDENVVDDQTSDQTDLYPYPLAKKPVIYLYPAEITDVSVNVKPASGISYSEPQITPTGWNVTANPDGTLIDANNTIWPYLFWEGNPWKLPIPEAGFVISQAEVSSFFDEKLSFLGLNITEIKDFKEYWVPVMQGSPYYLVSFVDQLIFNEFAPLTITPTPDTIIRVYFHHERLDKPIDVIPQLLEPAPKRTGFVVTEWGGDGFF